ncbi:MAG: outer membrane protein assembly factor BamC [Burkholderiaceae bacterium]
MTRCPPRPFIALAAAIALAGCSSVETFLTGDKVDYRTQGGKVAPLDVPPDLTQLARDSRYQPQSAVVSAAGMQSTAASSPAASGPVVAPSSSGNVRIERQGRQRWLVVNQTPEQLWPQLRTFWVGRGFSLALDDPQTGVMETEWAENRAKIPQDIVRRTLGLIIESIYSTGERDKFRTRVERTADGSEIFVSHRGLEEFMQGQARDLPGWRLRESDPQLEAEMLSRLMIQLAGVKEETARTQVAAAPELPARARLVSGQTGAVLEFDETFDRAWRRVGLALDRSGFTVEDRDRAAGVYFVRYVDPKIAGKEEPNFFARLFSSDNAATTVQRYRIAVKSAAGKTQISIQNADGAPEGSETGQRIATLLVNELK